MMAYSGKSQLTAEQDEKKVSSNHGLASDFSTILHLQDIHFKGIYRQAKGFLQGWG